MAKFKIDPEMLGDMATMKDAEKLARWLSRHGYDTEAVSVAGTGGPNIPDAVFYKGMNEVFNSRACNSTNPIVRNAMAANACAEARAENASAFPPDLWKKLGSSQMAREAAGRLKRGDDIDVLIKRFRDSAVGSQIPGRAADAARVAYALEEMKRRGIA